MARSHFRSQPSLQRTDQGAGVGWWLLGLLAVASVVAGVYSVGPRDLPLPGRTEAPRTEPTPRQVAEIAAATPPPEAEPIAPTVAPAPAVAPKARPPRARIASAGPAPEAPRLLTPMERYARGGDDYEEAMRAYNAAERQAGLAWASDNGVTASSQCEAIRPQRTAPFALGCLDYLVKRYGG